MNSITHALQLCQTERHLKMYNMAKTSFTTVYLQLQAFPKLLETRFYDECKSGGTFLLPTVPFLWGRNVKQLIIQYRNKLMVFQTAFG